MAKTDPQLIEVLGRNWLVGQIMQAGLEVAIPERDHGIDLILFKDIDLSKKFTAYPIQMKAATKGVFSLNPKYAKFSQLFIVYVWNVREPDKTVCYVLTFGEALQVAEKMGYTKTNSWITGGTRKRRGYSTTRPSKKLVGLLAPFKMDQSTWHTLAEHFEDRPYADWMITSGSLSSKSP